jgi:hypothetical protein
VLGQSLTAAELCPAADLEGVTCLLCNLAVYAGNGAWDDAPVYVAFSATSDCEGLARACLAVCKDGAIEALHAADHHRPSNTLKHLQDRANTGADDAVSAAAFLKVFVGNPAGMGGLQLLQQLPAYAVHMVPPACLPHPALLLESGCR